MADHTIASPHAVSAECGLVGGSPPTARFQPRSASELTARAASTAASRLATFHPRSAFLFLLWLIGWFPFLPVTPRGPWGGVPSLLAGASLVPLDRCRCSLVVVSARPVGTAPVG
jgi:hypothetical protein